MHTRRTTSTTSAPRATLCAGGLSSSCCIVVQLCTPGADYVIALDNGRVLFQGAREAFQAPDVLSGLVQSGAAGSDADAEQEGPETIEADLKVLDEEARTHAEDAAGGEPASETSSTAVTSVSAEAKADRKAPWKLVEEEKRAVGRIERSVYGLYIRASSGAVCSRSCCCWLRRVRWPRLDGCRPGLGRVSTRPGRRCSSLSCMLR